MIEEIYKRVRETADPKRVVGLQRFFKTGPGEYGEGDVFVGLTVPQVRSLAREFQTASLGEIVDLLRSAVHEERLLALLLLIRTFERGDASIRKHVYGLYRQSTAFINNWDLVDLSAPNILGCYLYDKSRRPLYRLVKSKNLWERRMAILATFYFIRKGEFGDTLELSRLLLDDKHDLIHKAAGWMLREIGKKDQTVEESFLLRHFQRMPRTMLRYAIEKFPERKKKFYMNK